MTTTSTNTATMSIEAMIDANLGAYGDPDTTRRIEAIATVWATNGCLIDPPLEAAGQGAINEMFAAVQTQFPGHSFMRTTAVDSHHGYARYGWDLMAADGTVALSGIDVAHFGEDGRLSAIVGFFGPLAPREA